MERRPVELPHDSPGPRQPLTDSATPEKARVLSRDLSLFLVQFSIALSKTKTYPPDHPALRGAVTTAAQRLASLFASRASLTIGIAKRQLLIEGAATDAGNGILRDLAYRLHRHQLGALRLLPGLETEELGSLLQALGDESWRRGEPLGLRPPHEFDRWPHARLQSLALDALAIAEQGEEREGSGAGQSARLWISLAAAALERPDLKRDDPAADPAAVARAIGERRQAGQEETYDRMIVGYLLKMGELLGELEGPEAMRLRERLARLIETLEPGTLKMMLEVGGTLAQRRQLVMEGARTLPVEVVLDLLEAAAEASQQTISHAMLRILTKLAGHAGEKTTLAPGADAALRDTVRQLVRGWALEDPNPGTHRRLLELLSRPAAQAVAAAADGPRAYEAPRVVQMALEVGTVGPAVLRAADEMVERGELPRLVEFLDQAGSDEGSAKPVASLWAHLISAENLLRLVQMEEADPEAVRQFVARMGLPAAGPMIDVLATAESQAVRRRLLAWIGGLGPRAAAAAVARLPGSPWYLQRNLLLLLGGMEKGWPAKFTPATYARHPDARVRREALKLLFQRREWRDDALLQSLADPDEGILHLGLGAALERCPPKALPGLLSLLDAKRSPEIRALAIRVLGNFPTAEVRERLVGYVVRRTRWLRRRILAHKSPELLSALTVLAAHWPREPSLDAVWRLVERHPDGDVRSAGRPGAA